MSKGWNENQIGWKYDDLCEDGYRFDNENLMVWCVVPRDKANNVTEAIEYLDNNINNIEMNQHT